MNPDSNSAIAALQRQVFTLLLALIVVTGTLTTFLYWQTRIAGKDIDAIKPQAQQVIGFYNQNQALMINFEKQLIAYGETHPEFRPVLKKYGLIPMAAPAAPVSPAAPAKR
jgi:hypothetical protein